MPHRIQVFWEAGGIQAPQEFWTGDIILVYFAA